MSEFVNNELKTAQSTRICERKTVSENLKSTNIINQETLYYSKLFS